MTNIRATCPECGEVNLTPDDIQLLISGNEEGSTYAFDCPQCVGKIIKPADARIIQLLISGGVRATVVEESDEPHPGNPFTYEDLLDFHLALEKEDLLVPLLNTV